MQNESLLDTGRKTTAAKAGVFNPGFQDTEITPLDNPPINSVSVKSNKKVTVLKDYREKPATDSASKQTTNDDTLQGSAKVQNITKDSAEELNIAKDNDKAKNTSSGSANVQGVSEDSAKELIDSGGLVKDIVDVKVETHIDNEAVAGSLEKELKHDVSSEKKTAESLHKRLLMVRTFYHFIQFRFVFPLFHCR